MKKPIYQIENEVGTKPKIISQLLRDPADLLNVENPEITVITACFNTGKFLEDTIRAVANQTFRSFEHWVIDGGSTDETLDIIKKYPHLKYISEKDSGPVEALWKGIRKAKGKYIIVCYSSDALASEKWFENCVSTFNAHPEVSLVWGLNQSMNEQGIIGRVDFSQFHYAMAPQKEKLFNHWLIADLGIPEMNLCASREAMNKCYPSEQDYKFDTLDWADFTYNFHKNGFLAYFLPVIASFSRVHKGQFSEKLIQSGWAKTAHDIHTKKWSSYRRAVAFGREKVVFIGRDLKPVGIRFSIFALVKQYLAYKLSPWYLLNQLKRAKKIPKKIKEKLIGQNI
jgi:glycosyltransferase involved in cell wall biosynthesis